ncbi:MAG: Smr/MutS family protein [Gammaproteobacteria bacterium]
MGERDDKPPEHDLFRQAMGDVEPLPQDRTDPYRRRRRPERLHLPIGDENRDEPGDLQVDTPDFLEFKRAGIQHRVFHDLQRGMIEAEATLDLHGMRVEYARKALTQFLAQSLVVGRRCVRIVHGKGRRSSQAQPILKQKTNQWLQQREEVLAFCSAPRWDGGTGAAYVLLSRKYARGEAR